MIIDPIVFILRFLFDNWWLLLPFLFWQIFWEKYKELKRYIFLKGVKYKVLELKFPKNITKSPKAMEEVFNSLHGIAPDPQRDTNWIKLNLYGFIPKSYFILIVAHDSRLRFFIRFAEELSDFIKTRIYSQYSEIQFVEVSDPFELLPPSSPNSLFDCEVFDVRPKKNDAYPIRTYVNFENLPEDQRIDPLTTFSEASWQISNKEWLIFQIFALPVSSEDEEYSKKWVERGNKLVDKLIGKKEEKKSSILEDIEEFIVNLLLAIFREPVWRTKEEKPKEEFNLQRLTPGERKVIELIQNKLSKPGFWCNIRVIYVASKDIFEEKKDTVLSLINSIFKNFSQEDINSFEISSLTKPSYEYGNFRLFLIKRREFGIAKAYLRPKLSPHLVNKFKEKELDKGFILNSEELASLFHPPMEFVPPTGIERIPVRELPPSFDILSPEL